MRRLPSLLISFFYIKPFLERAKDYTIESWILDSGAFSAFNAGKVIDLEEYIRFCLWIQDQPAPHKPAEIYALDVIGDGAASMRNFERMLEAGVREVIPTYHLQDKDEGLLHQAATMSRKLAIGGLARSRGKEKYRFAVSVFNRVWPKRIHGFACVTEELLMALPFHSADSTSWEMGPCAFGNYKSMGGANPKIKGSKQNLIAEINWYLDLQDRLRGRWAKEMVKLEALP